ncbi:hypothetical protein [Streptomyces litchfieldiae]|uniref:Integral membrane protein n=1 Tax=Streptomyces litchfieldiae TaxID=3075543 RepID=A0ABU2MSZ8_9ACTN|nr:hypothetical protein [Streptomyces sp. DSM 44938]MDT0344655.1 hypothetical protein [Streptomyces sp. DSM 44938]
MEHWWYRNITEPGKLPLLLALTAFVVTFLVVRGVTRLIRAGRGPFHDVSAGGQHVHHVVPGVVLMVVGGFGGVAAGGRGWVASLTAVVFGVGAGLVLDEFALILYLHDVYWTDQGRKSVEAVVLTAALVAMLLTGFVPLGVDGVGADERAGRGGAVATVLGNLLFVLVALVKGKFRLAVVGVLVPLAAFVGALRLARPDSPWAKRAYARRPRTRKRAERRARAHDARWGRVRRWVQQVVGGMPRGG